jgi:hypothetical protein
MGGAIETYNDHEDKLKDHKEIIDFHTKEIEKLGENFKDLEVIVEENKNTNKEQSILMKQTNDILQGMKEDFRTAFKWGLRGIIGLVAVLGAFLIWMLQILIQFRGGA